MDPILIIFGLGIGVLVGITGMGGGALMTPLLVLVFGVQPVTAIATDNLYGSITKWFGVWDNIKRRTVHLGIAFWLAIGSVPAAIAGVWVIQLLERHYGQDQLDQLVLGILGAALLVVGAAVFMRAIFLSDVIPERHAMHLYRRHKVAAVATGLTTGFVIGLTSTGSGTLVAITLITVFRLTPQRVVGTDIFHGAVLQGAAGIAYAIAGSVNFVLMANILIGSIPGVIVGARLASRVPQGLLRYALGTVLTASAIAVLAKEGTPGIVIPTLIVAIALIAALFGAQVVLQRQARPPRRARAG